MLMVFVALTLVMTYPLVLHIGSAIPGWPGDNFFYVWQFSWVQEALANPMKSIWYAPSVYYPDGFDLRNAELTPANSIGMAPVTAMVGPVVSYNVMNLLTFMLSAYFMYRLIVWMTDSDLAGMIAGCVFAFSAYRMAHFAGHPNLMSTQWVPLMFLGIEAFLLYGKRKYAILASLSFGLLALSTWYYAYFAALVLPIYLFVRVRQERNLSVDWRRIGDALLGGIIALAMVLPFTVPYLQFWTQGKMRHSFAGIDQVSAEITDYLIPTLRHPLWGVAVQRMLGEQARLFWVERALFLGGVALFLALFGVLFRWRDPRVRAILLLVLVAVVLSLGPTLHWQGERIGLPLPNRLANALLASPSLTNTLGQIEPKLLAQLQTDHSLPVPMPALFLVLLSPFGRSMRVWARFGVFVSFAIAWLAGLGIAELRDRVGARGHTRWVAVAAGTILFLLLFELVAIPYQITPAQPRPVDEWLRRQDGEFTIIEFPIDLNDARPLFYQTVHRKNIVNGAYVTFTPPGFLKRMQTLESFPFSAEANRELHSMKVQFVLVDLDAYGIRRDQAESALAKLEGLELMENFGNMRVYRLHP